MFIADIIYWWGITLTLQLMAFFIIGAVKGIKKKRREKKEKKELYEKARTEFLEKYDREFELFSIEYENTQSLYDQTCILQELVEKDYQRAANSGDPDEIQKYLRKMISLDKQTMTLKRKLEKLKDYEKEHY